MKSTKGFTLVELVIVIVIIGIVSVVAVPVFKGYQDKNLFGKSGREVATQKQKEMSKQSVTTVEIPQVSNFQERKTIAKWVQRWDKASIPAYLYIISFGKVLGYYVVDGKPASTTSYLMPEENVEGYGEGKVVVSAPDIDGTYGTNNPGIRFFTAEGAAVEWAGDGATFLYSDVPINFGYEVPRLSK